MTQWQQYEKDADSKFGSRLPKPMSVIIDSQFDCTTLDNITLKRRMDKLHNSWKYSTQPKKGAAQKTSDLCETSAAEAEEENDRMTIMWKGYRLESFSSRRVWLMQIMV